MKIKLFPFLIIIMQLLLSSVYGQDKTLKNNNLVPKLISFFDERDIKLNDFNPPLFTNLSTFYSEIQKKSDTKTHNHHNTSSWLKAGYNIYNNETFRNFNQFFQVIDFDNIDYPLLNAALFFMTNEMRIQNNLPPLEYSEELEICAYNYSKNMVLNNFFSHEDPNTRSRKTTDERGILAGICNPFIAENIAVNFGIEYDGGRSVYLLHHSKFSYDRIIIIQNRTYISLAEVLLIQWMDSPNHRKNILEKEGLQLGCGAYFYRDRTFNNIPSFKATQNFQFYEKIIKCARTDTLP